jgi:hypothetical protein
LPGDFANSLIAWSGMGSGQECSRISYNSSRIKAENCLT